MNPGDDQPLEARISSAYRDNRKHVRSSQLIDYRCTAKGCTLLAVWRSVELGGDVFYQPPYTMSPNVNPLSSNAAGRANNTLDGDRRWKEQGALFDQVRRFDAAGGLHLNCDHRSVFVLAVDLASAADRAAPGEPTRQFF